jgi:hypothetical protein
MRSRSPGASAPTAWLTSCGRRGLRTASRPGPSRTAGRSWPDWTPSGSLTGYQFRSALYTLTGRASPRVTDGTAPPLRSRGRARAAARLGTGRASDPLNSGDLGRCCVALLLRTEGRLFCPFVRPAGLRGRLLSGSVNGLLRDARTRRFLAHLYLRHLGHDLKGESKTGAAMPTWMIARVGSLSAPTTKLVVGLRLPASSSARRAGGA